MLLLACTGVPSCMTNDHSFPAHNFAFSLITAYCLLVWINRGPDVVIFLSAKKILSENETSYPSIHLQMMYQFTSL